MAPYTYTTKYQTCSKDSFRNHCEFDCCKSFSGGLTETFRQCSQSLEEDVECEDSFQTIETTADTCATDTAGNTCGTNCCMSVGNQTTCVNQAYCNGYNLDAYTRSNIIKYGQSVGVSIEPIENTENSASAIGGIVTFGMAIFILLVVIVVMIVSVAKLRKQNQVISYQSQSNVFDILGQAEPGTGKNLTEPLSDPAMIL